MSTSLAAPPGGVIPANGNGEPHSSASFWALTVGSVGVVYGDIGTSPLYAFREAVTAASAGGTLTRDAVLGVLSLILWALIVVVTLKYVLILLRADNKGEGGTLALMALAQRALGKSAGAVVLCGIISAALFYGDAIITPALSVLSAIEGLKLVTPAFDHYIVPLTVVILVALFAVQSRGTAKVAAFFGPITAVWFIAIAIPGMAFVAGNPEVLLAFYPGYAVTFLASHGVIGLITLGAVFLAVTGAEALYADLGHFGKRPIQIAWVGLVLPSLAVNYLGQGALVLADPKAIENPFFLLYPAWALLPMVVLATAATVIASQAVITGAYSISQQAIQLGLLPRLEIRHTSQQHYGQIFMPRVNLFLLVGVLFLVLMFRSSSALASAYGIAVTGTMVVTGTMAFVVVWKVWHWSPLAAAALMAPFLLIDLTFLGANMLKVHDGGWVPLALAAAVMVVMYTWRRGSRLLFEKTRRQEISLDELVRMLEKKPPTRVPGTAVFLTSTPELGADRAHAQPQALQGAARAQRDPDDRDGGHAAGPVGRARAHGAGERDLHPRDPAFRLHGDPERAEGARHRAQARLAIRHHVDLVLPVAALAQAGRPIRHAVLAGSPLHHAHPHRQRRHRLFPDSDRPGGGGRHAGDDLTFSRIAFSGESLPRT